MRAKDGGSLIPLWKITGYPGGFVRIVAAWTRDEVNALLYSNERYIPQCGVEVKVSRLKGCGAALKTAKVLV